MKTKKSRERPTQTRQAAHTHQAKTDETKYKTRPKKTGQKLKQAQQIPNTKARVSIQSEEPLKDDSE